jgi:radical SAM protein with 4Fe4S-binding SPASM domain
MIKRLVKQSLLRAGGYSALHYVYGRLEDYGLLRRYRHFQETGFAPLPDMVMFEPTQRCNLRCKMCFQDRGAIVTSHELTSAEIFHFFDQTPHLHKITLIGGEIFMRQDILDLIHHLDQSRDLVLCTNGTLLGEPQIASLRQCHRVYTMCISLDGPKEIHESIRRVNGSYDKAVHAISSVAGSIPVTVNCVIQDDNLQALHELVGLCAQMKAKKLKFELERLFLDESICKAMDETELNLDDLPVSSKGRSRGYSVGSLRNKLLECQRLGKEQGLYVVLDPPFLMDEMDACYSGTVRNKRSHICQSLRTATITPNGDVINCLSIRKPFGNILESPFHEIWNSETARAYRYQLFRNNLTTLCENCPFMRPLRQGL